LVSHTRGRTQIEGVQNRALSRIFGPKKEKVAEDWRRLHNEELHNLYNSPDIIRVIKLKRMNWAARVAPMGMMRNVHKILSENLRCYHSET
jgi:hypothetical protein